MPFFGISCGSSVITPETLNPVVLFQAYIWNVLVRLHEGVEFVPVLATAMVVVAGLNGLFPGAASKLRATRSSVAREFGSGLMKICGLFLSLQYFWIPFNKCLCIFTSIVMELRPCIRAQWLPAISMLAATAALMTSLWYTGVIEAYHGIKSKKASHRRYRTTRSGKVFGQYD